MAPRPFVFVLGFLVLLAGCATVPPEERAATCESTDWYRYGVNDGELGVPASDRTGMFEDCTELGHPVDLAAYRNGRAEGLKTYCTAQHGYEVGYKGLPYDDVCPPPIETGFLQGFRKGRQDRPTVIYPRIGIGIGTGWHSRMGLGLGWGGYPFGCYSPWMSDCYW